MFVRDLIEHEKNSWNKEINNPFLARLVDGNLSENEFKVFLEQDILYLKENVKMYGKAISISNNLEDYRFFYQVLGVIDDTDDSVQWNYAKKLGLTDEYLKKLKPLKNTKCSLNFLNSISETNDITKIIIAILPCLISYNYIFKSIKDNKDISNSKYKDLIENYSSYNYFESCQKWIDFIEKKCLNLDKQKKEDLKKIFQKACKLESNFWNISV